MISVHDADFVYEYKDHYKILPHMPQWGDYIDRVKKGVKVEKDFSYESSNKNNRMSIPELQHRIEKNLV